MFEIALQAKGFITLTHFFLRIPGNQQSANHMTCDVKSRRVLMKRNRKGRVPFLWCVCVCVYFLYICVSEDALNRYINFIGFFKQKSLLMSDIIPTLIFYTGCCVAFEVYGKFLCWRTNIYFKNVEMSTIPTILLKCTRAICKYCLQSYQVGSKTIKLY